MTNEQLEKQISEEFEKYLNSDPHGDGRSIRWQYLNSEGIAIAKDSFKAAALPLMKKIEELEKKNGQLKRFWEPVLKKFESDKFAMAQNKIALDSLTEAFDIFCDNEKLQKENEELREALDWVIKGYYPKSEKDSMTIGVFHTRCEEIRTKFNLDQEGGK